MNKIALVVLVGAGVVLVLGRRANGSSLLSGDTGASLGGIPVIGSGQQYYGPGSGGLTFQQGTGEAASLIGAGSSIVSKLSPGLAAAGPVGAIAAGGLELIAGLTGMFTKHHKDAVVAEAGALNVAFPAYIEELQLIFQYVNAQRASVQTAKASIDSAVAAYYQAVKDAQGPQGSIYQASGPCGTKYDPATGLRSGATILPAKCNGPCTVGCTWVEPWSHRAKYLLDHPGSTWTFDAIAPHAGFQGAPAWTLTSSRNLILA